MLTPIKKEHGVTESERYLSKLAEHTFLGLWSYPNIFTNEGMPKSKIGKELCDLLVIFDNKVIIFSDKEIKFNTNIDIQIAWKRWYKKSVYESARQLYGAEKWMREHPGRLFVDKQCQTKLPIELNHESLEMHLVAVTKNSLVPAKKYFDSFECGSSGSFIQNYTQDITLFQSNPFTIGDVNRDKSFVHVLDEMSLDLLMNELDTIYDFTSYLSEKVRLIRSGYLILAHGEEDLLAFFLSHKINGISCSITIPNPMNESIVIAENFWTEFLNSVGYQVHKSYKLGSNLFDFWLNLFSQHILSATVGYGLDLPFSTHENAIKFLAAENRISRAMIGKAFEEKFNEVPSRIRSARLVISPLYADTLYVFLIYPYLQDRSYDEYRSLRRNIMEAYALVAKYKHSEIKKIIVIATEPKKTDSRSEDIMSFNFTEDLDPSSKIQAKKLMNDEHILSGMRNSRTSYTNSTYKIGRNEQCPCGSGKKYKKCCLAKIR
jgi:SEC-C motif